MKCPKCGEDLIHLSGRYLCSDCGNEVPESEVSVGGWNFSEDEKTEKEEIPGNVQVNNFDDVITDSEDYLVEYKTTQEDTDNNIAESEELDSKEETSQIEETIDETEELNNQSITIDSPKGFYTAADIEDSEPQNEVVEIKTISEKADEPEVADNVEETQASGEKEEALDSIEAQESPNQDVTEDMLNSDLLDDKNAQAPVTIAPIDEELLTSPTMDNSPIESELAGKSATTAVPVWVKLIPIGLIVLALLGGLIYLVVDYVNKNNSAANVEIENPSATSWIDYKNSEHSFGVYLPVRPTSAKSTLKVGDQDLVTTIFESKQSEDNIYKVHVIELSESLVALEDDDLMVLLAENFVKKDGFALGRQEEVSVDTNFGLDIEAKKDQKTLGARLIKVENKVYVLSLVYNNDNATDKYQDFVRSFKIIQESI